MNPNQHSTPKSSNNEVHELRYRISQLEHLIVNSSLTSNNSCLNNSSLPSNSSSLNSQTGLIARINELEGLLAASELENEKLLKHLELLTVDKNRQEVNLLERLFKKDTEIKDFQHSQRLLDVKYQKSLAKLENIQEYVNQLPSQDELDEAQSIILKLQEENQLLDAQLSRLKTNFHTLQKDMTVVETAKNQAEMRLEELKPLEDAQSAILNEFSFSNQSMSEKDSEKILETLTIQKAQILRSTKIIESLREKTLQLETGKANCIIKITNLESDIESLQEQLFTVQHNLEKTEEKLKSVMDEKYSVENDNSNLRNLVQQRDNYLKQRDEHVGNLMRLVTEIDLCVKEVDKLVELGRSIAVGEEPSVTALLGLDNELEAHLQSLNISSDNNISSSEDISIPSDTEWALDRIVKVRQIRKHLNELRDIAGDLYSDMLGGKVEGCKVQ